MKTVACEQGTWEWAMARAAIPTASRFHRIMTPERQDYSKASEGLICDLLAEWLLKAPLGSDWMNAVVERRGSGWTDRGSELEADARKWYALFHGEVKQVGFVTNDVGNVGCSPDGLVGSDGGLEIKTPNAENHIKNMLGNFPAKMTQVQGCIWLTEREHWDVMSYHPNFLKPITRVWRDDPYIKNLSACVSRFNEEFAAAKERIEKMGEDDPRYEVVRNASDVNAVKGAEMDALNQDVEAAVAAGELPKENAERLLGWVVAGDWKSVRTAWDAIRKRLKELETA